MTDPDSPVTNVSPTDAPATETSGTNAPANEACPADATETSPPWCLPVDPSRRRVLETLAVGASLAVPGCGLFEADTGTTTSESRPTIDQTFRAPVAQNPAQTTFYAPWTQNLDDAVDVTTKERVSGRLRWIIREPGVWPDDRYAGTEIQYTWLEDIAITPTEITVKIGDDATWSDGNPITGSDIAVDHMENYLRKSFPPYFATDEKDEPTVFWDAIDDFDVNEQSVTFRSNPGYFEQWWDSSLRRIFAVGRYSGGSVAPTHIDPYDTYAEAVFEAARRAQRGEINPWKGWNSRRIQPDDPHRDSLVEKHLASRGTYVAKFSNPENVVSTSAWDLVEIDGPEAVFEPNTHHRYADTVNFDQTVLEYSDGEKRVRAALDADRLDYASPGPTPQSVVKSLPDTINQVQVPGGSGNELGLNFNHLAVADRRVRLALMYALDQRTIANTVHESAALPVTTPGGDSWNATEYVSEAWIDENLTTYTQDRDKAASLMQSAGYTRDGGEWLNADGEPLTLPLPTPNDTPRWEPTVASQLTEFGIPTTVRTFSDTTFRNRVRSGEFPIWAESGIATGTAASTLIFWRGVPGARRRYGIYPKEQFQTGKFSDLGIPVPRTEERWRVFTIQAPRIGHPNGTLQEYHPSALALAVFTHPAEDEFRRRVKTGMWLANWFLPTLPINRTKEQHFIDEAHWQWPRDSLSWNAFTSIGPKSIHGIYASGKLRANPNNPEKEG